MAFKDEAQINDSMDASMVDAPSETDEQRDTQGSFHERIGEDSTIPEESESEYPSM